MITRNRMARRTRTIAAALIPLSVLMLAVIFGSAPAHAQSGLPPQPNLSDPCRDAQGNELCPYFERNDGRINGSDPLQTATAYCQADHSLQVWAIINGVGQYAGTASAAQMESGLQTAVSQNAAQVILNADAIQLIGLATGNLQLFDTGSGYRFTFSPTVCGLPAVSANPNAPTPNGTLTSIPADGTLLPTLPALATIPAVAPIGSQIQNTISLYLWGGPDYSFHRTIRIPRGTFLTVIGKVPLTNGVQWIEVQVGTETGWVQAFYTNINVRVLRNLPIITDYSELTGSQPNQPTPTPSATANG